MEEKAFLGDRVFSVGAVVTTGTLALLAKGTGKGWLSERTHNAGREQLQPEACPGCLRLL